MSLRANYRNIFIVDSILWWEEVQARYDISLDLILTYDLGLHKKITALGGQVFYIDHLVDPQIMQKNNFLIYKFFNEWHLDANGNDIFIHSGISFGFSFRLEFWNDYTSYLRLRLCLQELVKLKINKIFLGSSNPLIASILEELDLSYTLLPCAMLNNQPTYYFPIAQWMDEKLRAKGLRGFLYWAREVITAGYGYMMPYLDLLVGKKYKKSIFIQEYHPTKGLIDIFRKDRTLKVVLANFSRGSTMLQHLFERLIPVYGKLEKYTQEIALLREQYESKKCAKLILEDGNDITLNAYSIIEERVFSRIAYTLRTLDSVLKYIAHYSLNLEILIANIGHVATLVDCVCKQKNIPSYLIINGMLFNAHQDDSKYATIINCYSSSMRDNYFHGMSNVVCLGDPRMDTYAYAKKNAIKRVNPTVTIGASGFNPVDLNSYVAIEFEFMYDVLSALSIANVKGMKANIIIKVRPNGYHVQYENFIKEFFPQLPIKIMSSVPMQQVLEQSDLYISIYSQTLFEASCLGIPCIYYKKDDEIMYEPFDGHSELVTLYTIDELVKAFFDFQAEDERYNAFLSKTVIEKYIGPLDGKNLQRNIDFIYDLLAKQEKQ